MSASMVTLPRGASTPHGGGPCSRQLFRRSRTGRVSPVANPGALPGRMRASAENPQQSVEARAKRMKTNAERARLAKEWEREHPGPYECARSAPPAYGWGLQVGGPIRAG